MATIAISVSDGCAWNAYEADLDSISDYEVAIWLQNTSYITTVTLCS